MYGETLALRETLGEWRREFPPLCWGKWAENCFFSPMQPKNRKRNQAFKKRPKALTTSDKKQCAHHSR